MTGGERERELIVCCISNEAYWHNVEYSIHIYNLYEQTLTLTLKHNIVLFGKWILVFFFFFFFFPHHWSKNNNLVNTMNIRHIIES